MVALLAVGWAQNNSIDKKTLDSLDLITARPVASHSAAAGAAST